MNQKQRYQTDPEYREKVLARNREYQREHRVELAESRRDYFKAYNARVVNKERQKRIHRQYLEEAWREVFKVYGQICACCGESNPAFLTLDHVNGGGNKDREMITGRKNSGTNTKVLLTAVKEADHEKYQILCFNCNCGRHYRGNGTCPHKVASNP